MGHGVGSAVGDVEGNAVGTKGYALSVPMPRQV